jgi:hypothetical protein
LIRRRGKHPTPATSFSVPLRGVVYSIPAHSSYLILHKWGGKIRKNEVQRSGAQATDLTQDYGMFLLPHTLPILIILKPIDSSSFYLSASYLTNKKKITRQTNRQKHSLKRKHTSDPDMVGSWNYLTEKHYD